MNDKLRTSIDKQNLDVLSQLTEETSVVLIFKNHPLLKRESLRDLVIHQINRLFNDFVRNR